MTGIVRMLPPDGERSRSEMVTTERVALVVYRLLDGAEMAEMTWQGAERLLDRASRVVPITKHEGRWARME
jgi:hypothetical protein